MDRHAIDLLETALRHFSQGSHLIPDCLRTRLEVLLDCGDCASSKDWWDGRELELAGDILLRREGALEVPLVGIAHVDEDWLQAR